MTAVDFDTIDIATLTDVPLLTTPGYVSLIDALVDVAPSNPPVAIVRALERMQAGREEGKKALMERLGDEVDTALERSFDTMVDQLWVSLRAQLEFWQLFEHPGVAMLTEADREELDLDTCREFTVLANKIADWMFGGGTDFLRTAYPQQSAHMASRLELIESKGHMQAFSDELVVSRAAAFVKVCQRRYEAMVKERASRDTSPSTDLRELRTSLRRTIRLYAMAVTGLLDEANPDSPPVVHRALPIVAAQPRRTFGGGGGEPDGSAEQGSDQEAPDLEGEPGPDAPVEG